MQLPSPRGALSEQLFARLHGEPGPIPPGPRVRGLDDDDFQISLFVLQELSFRRLEGVDPAWEEEPSLLTVRAALERQLEQELRDSIMVPTCRPGDVAQALVDQLDQAEGPSLSTWVATNATLQHLREFIVHRAAYQLKEADPHSFAIPRLCAGRAKTALLEIQLDEYGHMEPREAHAELFRATMNEFGLRPEADIDLLPAVTLRTNTVLNCFTRSRRLLGACLGHLAVFEMTSVEPMARYAAACRRLLPGPRGTRAARFYDVHVAADGHHQRVALDRLVAGFAEQYPDESNELLFGAAALMRVEGELTRHLLERWNAGMTSLRDPLAESTLPLLTSTAA